MLLLYPLIKLVSTSEFLQAEVGQHSTSPTSCSYEPSSLVTLTDAPVAHYFQSVNLCSSVRRRSSSTAIHPR
eukprot:NODE_438_length_893_cov_92.997630_g382_i0.p1 GENE.NODE_438_length_893_cov_92.997630_g382_i0~~NODE_438_length_893_cov_92.997630_g382_i0.p1  ORF type:complete len:72 (-),score=10.62 NODE_438_length_893_cov_92.997630_g382_i0:394-609(-)